MAVRIIMAGVWANHPGRNFFVIPGILVGAFFTGIVQAGTPRVDINRIQVAKAAYTRQFRYNQSIRLATIVTGIAAVGGAGFLLWRQAQQDENNATAHNKKPEVRQQVNRWKDLWWQAICYPLAFYAMCDAYAALRRAGWSVLRVLWQPSARGVIIWQLWQLSGHRLEIALQNALLPIAHDEINHTHIEQLYCRLVERTESLVGYAQAWSITVKPDRGSGDIIELLEDFIAQINALGRACDLAAQQKNYAPALSIIGRLKQMVCTYEDALAYLFNA